MLNFPDVTVLTSPVNPLDTLYKAYRHCYSSDISQNYDEITAQTKENLIDKCLKSGHNSPLEHISWTFQISNISRACSHQLVRHRIASYSQKSQRYVDEAGFAVVVPQSIMQHDHACDLFSVTVSNLRNTYKRLLDYGIPKEDARSILPNATTTSLIMTMNCRAILNFVRTRMCNRAQEEIRQIARDIHDELYDQLPVVFKFAGPSCLTEGKCSEGAFSCGNPYKQMERTGCTYESQTI